MDCTAFFLGFAPFADGYDMRMFSPVQNILPSFLPSSSTVQYESYYTYRPSDAVAGRASHVDDVRAGHSPWPGGDLIHTVCGPPPAGWPLEAPL